MRSSFEFSGDGEQLYGEDGGALRHILDDAIENAQIIVQEEPALLFELRRRLIEREELSEVEKMAYGELFTDEGKTANIIIVPSDFPPELMGEASDIGGYNTSRKQTMLRIYALQPDGTVCMTTQSLDRSNRQALEAIFEKLGVTVQEGELLSQRIKLALPPEWQGQLVNNLVKTYDESLAEQFGGEWHAGIRQQPGRKMVDTYGFANSQSDLIDFFTKAKLNNSLGAEKLRYKLAATAKARYERHVAGHQNMESKYIGPSVYVPEALVSAQAIVAGQNLMQELNWEGRRAAARGEQFSGCGSTVSSDEFDTSTTKGQLGISGLGNKSGSKSEKGVMRCVNCPSCRTYHEELRAKNGVFRCRNDKCGYTVKA